jgi:hypothetical protein
VLISDIILGATSPATALKLSVIAKILAG